MSRTPEEQATYELSFAEMALSVAAEDAERAAFRLRRAQIAVADAKQAVRDLREISHAA